MIARSTGASVRWVTDCACNIAARPGRLAKTIQALLGIPIDRVFQCDELPGCSGGCRLLIGVASHKNTVRSVYHTSKPLNPRLPHVCFFFALLRLNRRQVGRTS